MLAEVPGVIPAWADPTNYRQRPEPMIRNGYELVVSHGTSGRGDPWGPAGMFQQPHHGASSHFIVGQDGTTLQCVPLRFAAYHAHEANARSVGIEHCIRARGVLGPGDPGMPPSAALYQASARLQAYLLVAAGLQPDRQLTVRGHAEVDSQTTHTGCPLLDGWDWSLFWPLLIAEFGKLAPLGVG